MLNFKRRILEVYSNFMGVLFYVFLFGVLSFGRAFLVLHARMPSFPIFATEIFLLLNLPLLFYKYKSLAKLPKLFLKSISIFFIFGCFYLSLGLFKQNLFALKDVTLSLYILFLPISLIHLSSLRRIKFLIAVIILANIINLYSGFCVLLGVYPSMAFYNFMSHTKLINLGLYYGITSSFIISFYEYIKPKAYRLLALILLSADLCMIIMICKRSLWVALLALFVFLVLTLRGKFLKFFFFFVPIFILTSSAIFYFSSKVAPSFLEKSVSNKIEGSYLFFNNTPIQAEPVKTHPEPEKVVSEVKPALVNTPIQAEPVKTHPEPEKVVSEVKPALVNTPIQAEPVKTHPEPEKVVSEVKPALVNTPIQAEPVKASTSGDSFVNIIWRINVWKQTLKFAMKSPLIGQGFGIYPVYEIWGTFRYPVNRFLDSQVIPPHNHLITVFLKMGILGLGLFLFINIYVFVYGLSYLRKCNFKFINSLLIAFLGSFIFWHFFALFFDIIDSPPTNVFLWLIMGMIFAAVEIDKIKLGAE